MFAKTQGQKTAAKTLAAAFVAVAACTLLFNGLSEAALAAEASHPESYPADYQVTPLVDVRSALPEGYTPANYTVAWSTMHDAVPPAAGDLAMDEAAELGAQMLWEIFGVNLEGETLGMWYTPAGDYNLRATWGGIVRIPNASGKEESYYFTVDALTGQRLTATHDRRLDVDLPLGPDWSLRNNYDAYLPAAQAAVEKLQLLEGEIASTEFGGHGYRNNDPTISLGVYNAAGDQAQVELSRYDKELLSVSYPEAVKRADVVAKRMQEDIEKEVLKMHDAPDGEWSAVFSNEQKMGLYGDSISIKNSDEPIYSTFREVE